MLTLAVAGLVAGVAFNSGLINVEKMVVLYVTLPLGAIFLGLFLICKLLEKESGLYDEEQHRVLVGLEQARPAEAASADKVKAIEKHGSLVSAKGVS